MISVKSNLSFTIQTEKYLVLSNFYFSLKGERKILRVDIDTVRS